MREALLLAREAAADGEVPVGCVITLEDRIVGRGRNRREKGKTALAHAELELSLIHISGGEILLIQEDEKQEHALHGVFCVSRPSLAASER